MKRAANFVIGIFTLWVCCFHAAAQTAAGADAMDLGDMLGERLDWVIIALLASAAIIITISIVSVIRRK